MAEEVSPTEVSSATFGSLDEVMNNRIVTETEGIHRLALVPETTMYLIVRCNSHVFEALSRMSDHPVML